MKDQERSRHFANSSPAFIYVYKSFQMLTFHLKFFSSNITILFQLNLL